jgi:hypothetical protein
MANMDYNSINFKNKDVDKFATKFGNSEDPITKGMAQRKAAQEKKNADRIKAGIDSVVMQTPAQARAFDAKKKKQNENYNNSMDSWLDVGAKPNFVKGVQNAVKNTEKSFKNWNDKKEAYLKSKGI